MSGLLFLAKTLRVLPLWPVIINRVWVSVYFGVGHSKKTLHPKERGPQHFLSEMRGGRV